MIGEIIIGGIIGWIISYFLPCKETLYNIYSQLFKGITRATGIHNVIQKEIKKSTTSIGESLRIKEFENYTEIPEVGYSKEKMMELLKKYFEYDAEKIKTKHISGSFYAGNPERNEVIGEATKLFILSNPLHADNCPSVRKMEAEVIRMTSNMLHGDENSRGMLTTGGTESIILSERAHYQNAIKNKGIAAEECEIIMSINAHPAWLKGCELMHIKPIIISADKRNALDFEEVQKKINKNTILVVCSAPSYPHGVIDDIERVATYCKSVNVPVHVDACLGGFCEAWGEAAGFNVPIFDFRNEGVMSISCDTHKYGYAPKGSSVLVFRNEELRNLVFFKYPKWTGGLYCSPSIPGSRAGNNIAGAWASLLFTGKQGYIDATRGILTTSKNLKNELSKMSNIKILNDMEQDTPVVAFTTTDLNIYKVSDCMNKEFQWEFNTLQFPAAVHFCVTEKTIGCEKQFMEDLNKALDIIRKDPKNPKYNVWAPVYGMTSSLPDIDTLEDMVSQVIAQYCDVI
ncbi:sphingosine-1-phosphate lyase, putative [Entamoeba histolytica HM-1:IMSS-B]|uniref:sphinganine-1-phosphate aldolase n=8 Tax=Entamoeba histolytica TaxID=5759 RepID=C4M8C7_ENTH1|nr:s phingosine-1-phosphate lyase 1, putative [Entamoeba histolytica HM-1:IMSS]EMD43321.1 sphingosine 1-phosphate lyase, putative [Entamoeba histolytica KU27]EMH78233.1 sphingosine-1-phosphate lyase, putative [Entamoeba histolytica HM-1:IMSS-B]EMS15222.1 s phingosine-1-phosphate lyase 1, putative [Entamoeba histolytica HM-3:IMSS]ENY63801.1 s phingosine-1-phosphate lyase 1, putative [Entamoeba histolytica HM-1:IMSS-A]GAT97842.1 sphingosine 1 phosphate lyase 1 putative [Entamoeba histolytica]|eukprot:XP_653770.1 s phingosine-1-phosphate lyase 1, putative [Entamoeba histolytica HM-1:IMSS]